MGVTVMRFHGRRSGLPLFACLSLAVAAASPAEAGEKRAGIALDTGWQLQSSAAVTADGKTLSTPGYATAGWHKAQVPGTVVGSLVADGTYPDPSFGMNLRKMPGATYPIAKNFAHVPMPEDSPFRRAWWYRTEFDLPAGPAGRSLRLHHYGRIYRAACWTHEDSCA